MKRVFKIAGLCLLVMVAVVGGALAWTFGHNPPIPDGRDLPGGATVIKDGYVSVFLLPAGPGMVALIDAGYDENGYAILSELRRRGLTPSAVQAIFLTHGHPDHVAARALFPQADVVALAPDVPLLEGRVASRGPLPRLFGARDLKAHVTKALHGGETVKLADLEVEVFAVPGHTAGSAAYLAGGTLYLGDSADATPDGRLVPAKWLLSDDTAQNRAALLALAKLLQPRAAEIKAIALSHTGVLTGFAPLAHLAGLP